MSRISWRSNARISALSVPVAGVLFSSLGHSVPAAPHASAVVSHASAAVVRADQFQAQPLTDRSVDVTRQAAFGASDEVDGVAGAEVVEPATFIHHMDIGPDTADVSGRPQILTC